MGPVPQGERDAAWWLTATGYDARYAQLLELNLDGDEAVVVIDANGDERHIDISTMRRAADGSWEEVSAELDVPYTPKGPA